MDNTQRDGCFYSLDMSVNSHNIYNITRLLFLFAAALFVSCSKNDYVNVIPARCVALASVDMQKVEQAHFDGKAVLKTVLGDAAEGETGIDHESRIYLFEAKDGNTGLVARLKSSSDFEKLIELCVAQKKCDAVAKRGEVKFSFFNNTWLVAYDDNAMMVTGPITAADKAETERRVVNYFKQDEEQSVVTSKLYSRLDSIDSPIALVAQADALPDKLVAPFTLGAPKEADASQVMVAAGLSFSGDVLKINGTTYSENKTVDEVLKASHAKLRPISADVLKSVDTIQTMSLVLDVDGRDLLPMLQQNKGVQAMLTGLNMAIDMDNIVRSMDGGLVIGVFGYGQDKMNLSMTAKLGNSDWLKDVGYWKKSCPSGCRIDDAGTNAYCYKGGNTNFYFGVTPSSYFFCGANLQEAVDGTQRSRNPLPTAMVQEMAGKRMAMLLNIGAVAGTADAASVVKSVLGNLKYVLYVME